MNIQRTGLQGEVQRALGRSRAVVLAGPRQSGKTTLAASLVPRGGARWFDLEDPVDQQRLLQPMTAITALGSAAGDGPIVIGGLNRSRGSPPTSAVAYRGP